MRFKFCGDADCPDWILAEINMLSKLSSIKLKQLAQVAAQGILDPPLNLEKAEKLFVDSKLDSSINLKACIACISYIITSALKFNCDSNALHSELQQLGLPREHSTSIKRVTDEQSADISAKLKNSLLKINPIQSHSTEVYLKSNCVKLNLNIDGKNECLYLTAFALEILIENLEYAKNKMLEISNSPHVV